MQVKDRKATVCSVKNKQPLALALLVNNNIEVKDNSEDLESRKIYDISDDNGFSVNYFHLSNQRERGSTLILD